MTEMPRLAAGTAGSEIDRYWSLLHSAPSADHAYVSLLGLRTFDTAGLLERISEGLSFHSWERFVRATEIPKDLAAGVVGITPRTLARRKEEGRLHADESDRLIRLTRVFARAL
jgi:putative toxin-antitoxin system antitoxin component (TIGR02293 family)